MAVWRYEATWPSVLLKVRPYLLWPRSLCYGRLQLAELLLLASEVPGQSQGYG